MRKHNSELIVVSETDYGTQRALTFFTSPSTSMDFCVSLRLLAEKSRDSIIVPVQSRSEAVEIVRDVKSRWDRNLALNRVVLRLTTVQISFMLDYLLRTYRDGIADVDHIDIEVDNGDYVIVRSPEARAPLSADEAKRRLGL